MDLTPKNTVLIDRFEKTLKVKRSTARVYASSIASLAKKMNEKTDDLSWLKKKKIKKHVADINNLTRRKNLASGIVAALKVIDERKIIEDYRSILMQADKDYFVKEKDPTKMQIVSGLVLKVCGRKHQQWYQRKNYSNRAKGLTQHSIEHSKHSSILNSSQTCPFVVWSITKYVSSIQNLPREATTLSPTKTNPGYGQSGNTKRLNASASKSSQSQQDLKRFSPDSDP